jgi:hypothetical protein
MSHLDGINSIRWNELPWPVEWYDTSKVWRAASGVLFAFSCGSLAGRYYFSKVSEHSKLARHLTITALVMAVLTILVRLIPLLGRDPDYILQQRESIRANLQNNPNYGYKDMPRGFLNRKEIETLFYHDIQLLSYSYFKQKHGLTGLEIVGEAHPYSVKMSFLEHVKEEVSNKKKSLEAVLATVSHEKLNISASDLQTLKADCKALLAAQNKESAQDFIQQAEKEIIESIKDQRALDYLLQGYTKSFEGAEKSYDALNLGWEVVCLASKHPKYREVLREKFLKLPYHLLTAVNYEKDRKFLGITADEIKQALRSRWEAVSYTDNRFPDRAGFLASLKREFSPHQWTQKVLQETGHLTVIELARQWPELISTGILKAGSALPHQETIQQRLEKEIFDCSTCEEFIDKCPPALLAAQWIDPHSRAVSFHAAEFIYRNPLVFFDFTPGEYVSLSANKSFYYMHFINPFLPSLIYKLRKEICEEFVIAKAAIQERNQKEITSISLEKLSFPATSARLDVLLVKKQHELSSQLEELHAKTLRDLQEIILVVQPDELLKMNNFKQIVKKIEASADLCKRFAACLYTHRTEPVYAKLKEDFIQWVETKAQEGKLTLPFAWNINLEAERLFKNKYRFINGNEVVFINAFVLHALATQTKSSLNALFSAKLKEVSTLEICTDYDSISFHGLMEFYKTGSLAQFMKYHGKNEDAVTRLWELADRLRLTEIQDLINHEIDLTVDLPKAESESHDPPG